MKTNYTLLTAFFLSAITSFAQLGGSGTFNDPYRITTCDELQMMELHLGSYWILMNDIDCANTQTGLGQWTSTGFRCVGDSSTPFTGNFNGKCYAINNLYINNPSKKYNGLFGYTNNATVTSVKVINSLIKGGSFTAAIIGSKLSTTLDDCFSSGYVSGWDWTGGIVGKSDNYQGTQAMITNAFSHTVVNGHDYTGGVVGQITTFQGGGSYCNSCWATCNVTGNNYTGGVAGECGTYQGGGAQLLNCYAKGKVSGKDAVGGLVGDMGPVMGGGSYIIKSYAMGAVSGQTNVGGLAGKNGPNSGGGSQVYDSYARGSVTGTTNVGGLIGMQTATGAGYGVDTSYCTGLVTGTTNAGGFIGNQTNSPIFTKDYWNVTVNPSLQSMGNMGSDPNIFPSTTAQMQTQATYSGWNFTNMWAISNGNYPTLIPAPNGSTCNFPTTLEAAFNNSPAFVCFGDTVQFTDQSTGSPNAWSWNFGDPSSGIYNTSTLQNPVHYFTGAGTFYVTFIATAGNNKDTVITPIVVKNCTTGMTEDDQLATVSVYPNPTSGKFIITATGELTVFNMIGEAVYSQRLVSAASEIDLSGKPAGVYLLHVRTNNGTVVRKIIKE